SRGEPSDAGHAVTKSGSLAGTGGQPDRGCRGPRRRRRTCLPGPGWRCGGTFFCRSAGAVKRSVSGGGRRRLLCRRGLCDLAAARADDIEPVDAFAAGRVALGVRREAVELVTVVGDLLDASRDLGRAEQRPLRAARGLWRAVRLQRGPDRQAAAGAGGMSWLVGRVEIQRLAGARDKDRPERRGLLRV